MNQSMKIANHRARVKAALVEHADAVLDHVADSMILLGSQLEWSMEDNFNVTEGIAGLATDVGLPCVGDQDEEALNFWSVLAADRGYRYDGEAS